MRKGLAAASAAAAATSAAAAEKRRVGGSASSGKGGNKGKSGKGGKGGKGGGKGGAKGAKKLERAASGILLSAVNAAGAAHSQLEAAGKDLSREERTILAAREAALPPYIPTNFAAIYNQDGRIAVYTRGERDLLLQKYR